MTFVRVAWLYGPNLQRPMMAPTVEDLRAALHSLGTPAAYSLHLYSRVNLDRTNDQEMTILGWEEHFHIQVVDNNVSEEEVYCYRGGVPSRSETFMFPVEGDLAVPMSEVLTDRGRVHHVAMAFFESGFKHDDALWTLHAPG